MAGINKIGITKKDLKDALKGVARAKDVNDLAGDLVRIEKKVEGIEDKLVEHDKTLDRIVGILEELSKIESIEKRLERVEAKLGL
jgi:predicted  nucleic acid-binding Zn-ribbon protein